jgi:hypothetical protein
VADPDIGDAKMEFVLRQMMIRHRRLDAEEGRPKKANVGIGGFPPGRQLNANHHNCQFRAT